MILFEFAHEPEAVEQLVCGVWFNSDKERTPLYAFQEKPRACGLALLADPPPVYKGGSIVRTFRNDRSFSTFHLTQVMILHIVAAF